MERPLALKEIIEERKSEAIEKLSEGYAKNRLPLEEYERLVEYINKIESERELVVVEKIAAEYEVKTSETKTEIYDDDEDEPDFPINQNSSSNLAILSSRTFSGPLKSGEQFVSMLGSQYIKIRKSDLPKRKTVLNVVSILGESIVYVESGIRVRNKAIPVLGSSRIDNKVSKQAQQDEAELVISGVSLLGEITVKLLKE